MQFDSGFQGETINQRTSKSPERKTHIHQLYAHDLLGVRVDGGLRFRV